MRLLTGFTSFHLFLNLGSCWDHMKASQKILIPSPAFTKKFISSILRRTETFGGYEQHHLVKS